VLNLLFISDSPKIELIRKELQAVLKVMIDVVTDFDRGMKDVFEKRPATICIQDNIGNVSGESVARHVQMLLGSGAPTFILLHSGNSKVKVINGVFDHLVDLSLPNDAIIEIILAILKPLLGNQWERVFIPPMPKPNLDQAVTPEKLSHAAQQKTVQDEKSAREYAKIDISPDALPIIEKKDEKRVAPVIVKSKEPVETPTLKTALKKPAVPAPHKTDSTSVTAPPMPPAEAFRISQNTPHSEETIPEDLFFAFKENYRSRSLFIRRCYVVALICIVSASGAWYLFTLKPQMLNSLKERFLPSSVAKQAPKMAATVIPAQKPVPPPLPPPVAAPALPSFIPQGGVDSSFAQKNPGWKRFVGEKYDFRVFIAKGRIEALQVLSISAAIPGSLIKSVLQEFTGISKYQILSRSIKDGVRVESGKVQDKGEIKIYRKNGSVKAFVVSVN